VRALQGLHPDGVIYLGTTSKPGSAGLVGRFRPAEKEE